METRNITVISDVARGTFPFGGKETRAVLEATEAGQRHTNLDLEVAASHIFVYLHVQMK